MQIKHDSQGPYQPIIVCMHVCIIPVFNNALAAFGP